MSKRKQPRHYSLITLTDEANEHWLQGDRTRFHNVVNKNVNRLLFLSEIPNMRGHCIVWDITLSKMHIGYHTDNFRELTDEET